MMRVKDCRAKEGPRVQAEEAVDSTRLMRRLARPIDVQMERISWMDNLAGYLDRDR